MTKKDSLAFLFEEDIKGKKTRSLNNPRVQRVLDSATEVIVKISGNTKGSTHTLAHLEYVSRNGDVELENERGEIIKGKSAVKSLHQEWIQDSGKQRVNTRNTTNIVLSMPEGTEPSDVKNSARSFAKKQFGDNYQYVFALHTDADHPHVHLTVKNLGFDGKRLHIKKGDPQIWREEFAEQLRNQGIDAEATPRAVRGVVRKGIVQALVHLRDRGINPVVDQNKIKEVLEDFKDSSSKQSRPWEQKIKDRQTEIRKGWLAAAKELNSSADPKDKAMAASVVKFMNDMPPLDTERHAIAKNISEEFHSSQRERLDDLDIEFS